MSSSSKKKVEGLVAITNFNDFIQNIHKLKYYQPSTTSIKAVESFHVTDNDFQSIQNDIISYSNYLIGKEGSNKNSSVLFKLCNYNHSLIINLCIHIECFDYRNSKEFYPLFLNFTSNTFAIFSADDRQLCFENITQQFDSIEEVINDLDSYSFIDNLSSIMDAMLFDDKNKANLFVNELNKTINSISIHEHQQCEQIVVSMFKLWNIWLTPDDETIQQIANIFDIITPQKYILHRDIFIQTLIKQYLQFPEQKCSTFMIEKMNTFMLNEYGINNYCNIGRIINTKLLPYMPLLSHLLNNNKMKIGDVKLLQMIFFIAVTRGIPNIINVFNNKQIHFDIAFIFNQNIIKNIKKLTSDRTKQFLKPIKMKKIKKSNYYNLDNIYNYLFTNLINILQQKKNMDCDLIRIYIDMSKASNQYYPQFFVEISNDKIGVNGTIQLFSALLARKRYESDIGFVRKCIINQESDQEYMLLSNVITSVNDNSEQKYKTEMYLQYCLGIMRFMKCDIYEILPKCFQCNKMNEKNVLNKCDDDIVGHLYDNTYNELLDKFNKFIFHKRI